MSAACVSGRSFRTKAYCHQVIERVAQYLEEAAKVLEKAESLATQLDTESARGSAAIVQELQQIHRMIDQIRRELESTD